MKMRDPTDWMWAEALDMLERADRLHRRFFQPGDRGSRCPTWEPPIDVFESAREFILFAALPGVESAHLDLQLDGRVVVIRGQRAVPDCCKQTTIRRMEIPYGRFERRVDLPEGQYQLAEHSLANGCLMLILRKMGAE